MAYAEHIRMTALGRLGSASGERFSYSLNFGTNNGAALLPFTAAGLQDAFDDCAADVVAFHGSQGAGISPPAVLEEVKFARIGTDGKYTDDPYLVNVTDTPGGSNSGFTGGTPPQSALCISLTTGRRGPSGKGRFYVPMFATQIDSATLLMPDAIRDAAQAQAATFIEALGNQPGIDALGLKVVVASTKGYNTVVNGVRVGRVVDTIRSRRRQLPEAYDPITPVDQ